MAQNTFSPKHTARRYLYWFIILACVFLWESACAKTIYVAPDGEDAHDGTEATPFATLERARAAVRSLKESGLTESVIVTLRQGKYFRSQSFVLNERDSGTAETPILYQAYPGETVRMIGGMELSARDFIKIKVTSPVWGRLDQAAQGKVWAIDLTAQGLDDFGQLRMRGFRQRHVQAPLELIFNRRSMTLARWPNQGFALTTSSQDDITFGYDGDRPGRWMLTPEPWVFGYFCHGWADEYQSIAAIDPLQKTITLADKPGYGIKAKKGWYALNILEELDSPGEWVLERDSGMLYFWPPELLSRGEILVSLVGEEKESVLAFENAAYITFKNIDVEFARYNAITIKNGDHIVVEGATISNVGCQGVSLSGISCQIVNSEIYDVGADGVSVSGGGRAQLIPGRNEVSQCLIHDFGRLSRTYTPAIRLSGVGNTARHNDIHDGPHSGIMYGGNEHRVEYNDVSRCCLESDDAGAFYSGRDWGARGNVIRYNFFHHIQSDLVGSHGVHAVYLDDCLSGTLVYGNIFYQISGRAVMCGGGRDNRIVNNVMVACGSAHFTDRRGKKWVRDEPGSSWNLREKIERYQYTQPPWSTAYPRLATIMNNGYEQAKEPEGCEIRNNMGWKNGKWLEENCLGACDGFDFYTIESNIEDQDPKFVDMENLNLALLSDSPAFSLVGFEPIPFEKIGRD